MLELNCRDALDRLKIAMYQVEFTMLLNDNSYVSVVFVNPAGDTVSTGRFPQRSLPDARTFT